MLTLLYFIRFIVRDFQYDETSLEKQKLEAEETISSEREQQQTIIRLAKTNFSEVFSSWVHLKALRIFVESVLRYGLPPDFTAAVIEVGLYAKSRIVPGCTLTLLSVSAKAQVSKQ